MKALPFIIIRGVNYNTYEKNAIFQVTKYQLWLTAMLALGALLCQLCRVLVVLIYNKLVNTNRLVPKSLAQLRVPKDK